MLSRISKGLLVMRQACHFNTGFVAAAAKNNAEKIQKGESERMKEFHEKLKSSNGPSAGRDMQYGDILMTDADAKNGETMKKGETDPTKWGDWQTGGRVSDF